MPLLSILAKQILINPAENKDRLKTKYEAEGKNVNVTNGSLFIDNVLLFSLEAGFVKNQQNGQD
jgi:hypothetical protein